MRCPQQQTRLYVFDLLVAGGGGGAGLTRHMAQALGHIITQWQYVRIILRVVVEEGKKEQCRRDKREGGMVRPPFQLKL